MVTCWVPFMDTDVHNGGMGVMEGSHRLVGGASFISSPLQLKHSVPSLNLTQAKIGSHFGCEGDTWYVGLDKSALEEELHCTEQDERRCKGVLLYGTSIELNAAFQLQISR